MKKSLILIVTLLILSLALSLVSCSVKEDTNEDAPSASDVDVTEESDANNDKESNTATGPDYVFVTNYIGKDGTEDVTSALQTLINNNPQKTLYFPDGEYLLSSPLRTSANPAKSVHFVLSNYATLIASESWSGGALISLGGGESYNNITECGSNYGIDGGIFDCRGISDGIEIASGRETYLRNISIKNAVIGIHILDGADSGSSDADITNCNITGNNTENSIGIQIDGCDNTISNVRIGHCQMGVILNGGGNILTYIHPLYIMNHPEHYDSSVAFLDNCGTNTYCFCYNDQFCTGYKTTTDKINVYNDCWAHWYSGSGGKEIAFCATDAFNSLITRFKINFSEETTNTVLSYDKSKINNGYIQDLIGKEARFSNNDYEAFLRGSII